MQSFKKQMPWHRHNRTDSTSHGSAEEPGSPDEPSRAPSTADIAASPRKPSKGTTKQTKESKKQKQPKQPKQSKSSKSPNVPKLLKPANDLRWSTLFFWDKDRSKTRDTRSEATNAGDVRKRMSSDASMSPDQASSVTHVTGADENSDGYTDGSLRPGRGSISGSSMGKHGSFRNSTGSGSFSAKHRLAPRVKHKPAVSRDSAESTRSSSSFKGLPFPLLRSPSSFSGSNGTQTLGRQHGRRSLSTPPVPGTPTTVVSEANDGPLPPKPSENCSPEQYAEILLQFAPPTSTRWRRVCAELATGTDTWTQQVIVAFLKPHSAFKGEPVDMSLRKFLMWVQLPTETQQIERVLQAFSEIYATQNPGIFADAEQVLFVVFSLVMLHTDTFNRNVRHKMAKNDYVQTTLSEGIKPEVLEYLYDNITCLQFPRDELPPIPTVQSIPVPLVPMPLPLDLSSPVATAHGPSIPTSPGSSNSKMHPILPVAPGSTLPGSAGAFDDTSQQPTGEGSRRSTLSLPWNGGSGSSSSGATGASSDVYTLLLSGRLDALRPNLEDPVSEGADRKSAVEDATGILGSVSDLLRVRDSFSGGGKHSIQLLSPRSRPDAYLDHVLSGGSDDPAELSAADLIQQSRPGVVEIKVIKHGVLLRPEPKRMLYPTRPGWREWGAVLTESQLYLFKNPTWIKSIAESSSSSNEAGHNGSSGTITRAPVEALSAANVYSTTDLAAMLPSSVGTDAVTNTFEVLSRGDSMPTLFATQSSAELMDWVRIINVAATYATFRIPLPVSVLLNSGITVHRSTSELSVPSVDSLASSTASPPPSTEAPQSRTKILVQQLQEVDRQLASTQAQMDEHCSVIRHLKLLAPIQQRTREAIVYAAGQYASKLDTCRLERKRLRCYKHIMELDLRAERYIVRESAKHTTSSGQSS